MTSFAFILGSTPLWFASGAGAVSRRILGTVVIGGMLAATCIAVLLIPVTFYVIEKLATRARSVAATASEGKLGGGAFPAQEGK
jgi:HAE1 family hydrophobic/amphiphilic exporter-1